MDAAVVYGIVYRATCSVNGKVYIGQTYRCVPVDDSRLLVVRRRKHENMALKGVDFPFYAAMRKHGIESFRWEIVCHLSSVAELDSVERRQISDSGSMRRDRGYNAMSGGRSREMSDGTKQKMSEAAKRRWQDPEEKRHLTALIVQGQKRMPDESRRRMGEPFRRLHQDPVKEKRRTDALRASLSTPEFRSLRSKIAKEMWKNADAETRALWLARINRDLQKGRETMRGRPVSAETRRRLSTSGRMQRARPFEVRTLSGDLVGRFDNVVTGALAIGSFQSNLSACLHGKIKTTRGMVARFLKS